MATTKKELVIDKPRQPINVNITVKISGESTEEDKKQSGSKPHKFSELVRRIFTFLCQLLQIGNG
jgi:hypothetical protein